MKIYHSNPETNRINICQANLLESEGYIKG